MAGGGSVNKDAIGILFGVAGASYGDKGSYDLINDALDRIVEDINANRPKLIKVRIDEKDLQTQADKVNLSLNGTVGALKTIQDEHKKEKHEIDEKTAAYNKAKNAVNEYKRVLTQIAGLNNKQKRNLREDELGDLHSRSEKLRQLAFEYNKTKEAFYNEYLSVKDNGGFNELDAKMTASLEKAASAAMNARNKIGNFSKTTLEEEERIEEKAYAIRKLNEAYSELSNNINAIISAGGKYGNGIFKIEDITKYMNLVSASSVSDKIKEGHLKNAVSLQQRLLDFAKQQAVQQGEENAKLSEEEKRLIDINEAMSRTMELASQLRSLMYGGDKVLFDGTKLFISSFGKMGSSRKDVSDNDSRVEAVKAKVDELNATLPQLYDNIRKIDSYDLRGSLRASFKELADILDSFNGKTNETEENIAMIKTLAEGFIQQHREMRTDPETKLTKRYLSKEQKSVWSNEVLQSAQSLKDQFGPNSASLLFNILGKRFGMFPTSWKDFQLGSQAPQSGTIASSRELTQDEEEAQKRLAVETAARAESEKLLASSKRLTAAITKEQLGSEKEVNSAVKEGSKEKKNAANASKTVADNTKESAKAEKENSNEVKKTTKERNKSKKAAKETADTTKTQADAEKTIGDEAQRAANAKIDEASSARTAADAAADNANASQNAAAGAREESAAASTSAEKSKEKAGAENEIAALKEKALQNEKVIEELNNRIANKTRENIDSQNQLNNSKEKTIELEKTINITKENGSKLNAENINYNKLEIKDFKRMKSDALDYYRVRKSVIQESLRNGSGVTYDEAIDTFAFSPELSALEQRFTRAKTLFQQASAAFEYAKNNGLAITKDSKFIELSNEMEKLALNSAEAGRKLERTAQGQWDKLSDKANTYVRSMQDVATRSETAKTMLADLQKIANSGDFRNYDKLRDKLGEVQRYINENGLATEKWYQKMKRTFGTRVRSMVAGMAVGKIMMAIRSVYSNVVDINSAMTQLKIVTGATDAQMNKFLTNSTKLAKELGSSISDVLKSVETFSRLGYNLEEATGLAKYANILSKVAATSADDATKGLTSIIKGYGFEPQDAERVADVLVTVGQKYAVSASELMEAYQKAGAALNASNTSFEKSAALIAAANAAVQDASSVGTALKTVSARIRKSKTDLDELGESTDDLTEAWSYYAKEIQALTGFDIMKEGSTTEFKDIYEIFGGIAEVADKLSDTDLARVSEILGGTRQYSIISSILRNWGDAAGAYADAMNAAGASTKAMDIYANSVQGKIGQLKAAFGELSNAVLSSDLIAFVVDLVKTITNIANGITKVAKATIGLKAALVTVLYVVALIKKAKIASWFSKITLGLTNLIMKLTQGTVKGQLFGSRILTALRNMSSGLSAVLPKIALVVTAFSILSGIIDNIRQKIEENKEEAAQASQASAQNEIASAQAFEEEARNLQSLRLKYQDLVNNGGPLEEVRQVQSEINELLKEQGEHIDENSGKYEDYADAARNEEYVLLGQARDKAKEAVVDAEAAILGTQGDTKSKSYRPSASHSRAFQASLGKQGLSPDWYKTYEKKYGIKLDQGSYTQERGVGGYTYGLAADFASADQFVKQYENIAKRKQSLAMLEKMDADQQEEYRVLQKYLTDFKDVYDTYVDAAQKYNDLSDKVEHFWDTDDWDSSTPDVGRELTLAAKTVSDILTEIQDKYDAIVDSMNDMEEHGAITVKTFQEMLKQGLGDYLTQTEDGFVLNEAALQDYIAALIETYSQESLLAGASEETRQIAIENLKNLRVAIGMLALSTDQAKKAAEAQKKVYEDEKDALKNQLDAYKELIDLRKDLLKQYKDELDYKKELAKKESNVASLQTKLAVSQLDTSAAGRAKTRQLEKELKEAQEELDDFTLEHAIDVVTNELDEQYEEYKKLIDGKIDEIEQLISDLSGASSLGDVADGISNLTGAVTDAINRISGDPSNPGTSTHGSGGAVNSVKLPGVTGAVSMVADIFARYYSDILDYAAEEAARKEEERQKHISGYYRGGGRRAIPMEYHSGGIVGNGSSLKSTEEYAKLLKGEFVSTPAMMSRFMNRTLPNLVTAASNAFNAPLVNINCDTVTKDALPGLNQIVQQAVTQIKREFDTGMIRSGYRKSAQKIAI